MTKHILDLCAGSGAWSKPYSDVSGYTVHRIDIEKGLDVRLILAPKFPVYGILAAPPCTMFSNAGNRWKRSEANYLEAISVVDACLRLIVITKPRFWALENPIGKLTYFLGQPRYRFHPCYFGHPYTKQTLLWGEFNIPKEQRVNSIASYAHTEVRNPKKRAETFSGFAKAFFEVNK